MTGRKAKLLLRIEQLVRERDESYANARQLQNQLTERDALDAAHLARDGVEEQWEERVEYGQQTVEAGWIPEYRGIAYARQQRTVQVRVGEPVDINHWSYADHRHPVEGCTFCADLAAKGERPVTTGDHVLGILAAKAKLRNQSPEEFRREREGQWPQPEPPVKRPDPTESRES